MTRATSNGHLAVPIEDTGSEVRSFQYVFQSDDGFEVRTAVLVPTGIDVSDPEAIWRWALDEGFGLDDIGNAAVYRNRAENTAVIVRFR